MPTLAWFLAAARTSVGPPMSISSISSSSVAALARGRLRERVEVDDHQLERLDCAAASCSRWSASRWSASTPAAIRGWSVLTRPSSISGKPVTSATSVTSRPCLAQRARRAAGRDELEAEPGERASRRRPDRSCRRPRGALGAAAAARGGPVDARDRRRRRAPARAATTRGSSRCSTAWTRAQQAIASSSLGRTATASWATIGPPSSVSSTRWTVTPVTLRAGGERVADGVERPGTPATGSDGRSGSGLRNASSVVGPSTRRKPASTTQSTPAPVSASATAASHASRSAWTARDRPAPSGCPRQRRSRARCTAGRRARARSSRRAGRASRARRSARRLRPLPRDADRDACRSVSHLDVTRARARRRLADLADAPRLDAVRRRAARSTAAPPLPRAPRRSRCRS